MTVWKWSKTAASNTTADSTANWREGQSPGSVNNSARAVMAAIAKYRDDMAGNSATGGTSSAYTLTTNQVYEALTDGMMVAFTPHVTNIASATLAVDELAAKPLRITTATAIAAGVIVAGTPYAATYNSGADEWRVHGLAAVLDSYPIVILATGQSNMALPEKNLGDTEFTTYTPAPNLYLWNNLILDATGSGDTSTDATGTAFIAPPSNRLLVSLAAANEIAKDNPKRPVYVINTGYSGQAIAQWMAGASAPDVFDITVNNVNAALTAIGVDKVDLLMWWQGESDASSTTYPNNFQTVINRFYAQTWFPRNTQIQIFAIGSSTITSVPTHDGFVETLRRVVSQEPQFRRFIATDWVAANNWDAFLHARLTGYSKIGKLAGETYLGRGSGIHVPYSGSWTPKLLVDGADSDSVYNTTTTRGRWTRVGRLVTVMGRVQTTTKLTDTGNLSIGTLPFVPSVTSLAPAALRVSGYPTTNGEIQAYAQGALAQLILVRVVDSAGAIIMPQLNENNVNDNFDCWFSLTYEGIIDAIGSN